MAGRPHSRIRKAVDGAVHAVQEGRTDEARELMMTAAAVAKDNNIPLPEIPEDVEELWLSVVETKERDLTHVQPMLSDEARQTLVRAAEMAANRMLSMVEDDTAFGVTGWLSPAEQLKVLDRVVQRGFGTMPSGARKVQLAQDKGVNEPLEEGSQVGKKETTQRLTAIIKGRKPRQADIVDITPAKE